MKDTKTMTQLRCFNSFEELADFQRQQDTEKRQAQEDWVKSNPYVRDPLETTPIMDNPYHKVYDRGAGIDVPLSDLIDKAKDELTTRKKTHRPIGRVKNIKIYEDDYENGNYDIRFYGEVLPRLIKQTQKNVTKQSPAKSYDEICDYVDSPDYYVGRSEDEIIEKLATLPLKDKNYYNAPSWRIFKRHLKDLDNLFTDKSETSNREVAHAAALKCITQLSRFNGGAGLNTRGIIKGFDLAARLGDYLGYDLGPMLKNMNYGITREKYTMGAYEPMNHLLKINPAYTDKVDPMCSTIFHELFHAMDARLDVDSVMENAIPEDEYLTKVMKEILVPDPDVEDPDEKFAMVASWDHERLNVPTLLDRLLGKEDAYSAVRYLMKRMDGGGDGFKKMSEFISALLSDYIEHPNRINKNWLHQVLTAFSAAKEAQEAKKQITDTLGGDTEALKMADRY